MSRPKGFKHTEKTKQLMRENHGGFHRPHTEESKEQTAKALRLWHKTHEHPCKGKKATGETKRKMSLARQGSKNSNWKGGLTKIIRGIRRSPEYHQWRKAVLERDGHKCKNCGSGKKLHTHHINSIFDCPLLIFDINNGLVLCDVCHKKETATNKVNSRSHKKCKKRK